MQMVAIKVGGVGLSEAVGIGLCRSQLAAVAVTGWFILRVRVLNSLGRGVGGGICSELLMGVQTTRLVWSAMGCSGGGRSGRQTGAQGCDENR